jgi:hypothetical protein
MRKPMLLLIVKSSPNAPGHPVSTELIILPCHQFDDVARSSMKKEREVVSQKRNQVDTRTNDRRNQEKWVGAGGSFLSSFSSLSSRSSAPLHRLPPVVPTSLQRSHTRRLPPARTLPMCTKSAVSISFSRYLSLSCPIWVGTALIEAVVKLVFIDVLLIDMVLLSLSHPCVYLCRCLFNLVHNCD